MVGTCASVAEDSTSGSRQLNETHFVTVDAVETVTTRCYLLFAKFKGKEFGCIIADVVEEKSAVFKESWKSAIATASAIWLKEVDGTATFLAYSEHDLREASKDYQALIDGFTKNASKTITLVSRRPT